MPPKKGGQTPASSRPTTKEESRQPADADAEERADAAGDGVSPLLRWSSDRCSLDDLSPGGFVDALRAESGPGGDPAALRAGVTACFAVGDGSRADALCEWHAGNLRFCRRLSLSLLATARVLRLCEEARAAFVAPADAQEGRAAAAALLRRALPALVAAETRTAVFDETVWDEAPPEPPERPPSAEKGKPGRKASKLAADIDAAPPPPRRVARVVEREEEVRVPAVLQRHDAELVAVHISDTLLRRGTLHRFVARRPQAQAREPVTRLVATAQAPRPLREAREEAVFEEWARGRLEAAAELAHEEHGERGLVDCSAEPLARADIALQMVSEHADLHEAERDRHGALSTDEYTHALGCLKYALAKEKKGGEEELKLKMDQLGKLVEERIAALGPAKK